MKRCTVEGCDRKHKARGLCHAHHMQQLRAARRAPRANAWQPWEDALIHAVYPHGGANATQAALLENGSERTCHAVTQRAGRLRVSFVPHRVAIDTTRPRTEYERRAALYRLAERAAAEGMTATEYEREQARILGGQA